MQKLKSFLFENREAKQTVAKNTFWLTVSNFGGRGIKAIIIIYGARVLGTAGWGVLSYAITLAGFLTLLIDPGVNAVLVRNIAKTAGEERKTIFSTIFFIKLALVVFGVFVILGLAPFVTTLPGAKVLLPIAACIFAFDTLREFFSAYLRAHERMETEAAVFLATNLAIIAATFMTFGMLHTTASFGWGYAIGTAIGALAALYAIRIYAKEMWAGFSPSIARMVLQSAWPFAIVGALGLLLTNTDILILSWMRTAAEVGIYSAAIRIIQILYFIPVIFQYSTLPLFARLARKEDAQFRKVFERIIALMCMLSIPMALGGVVWGTSIMTFVFGAEYGTGGLAFKILMATMLIDFSATIVSSAIFTYDHQKSLIISSAIGGGANVLLDVLFIPSFGMAGSAVATLISQTMSTGYLWYTMQRLNKFRIVSRLKYVAIAGVVMTSAAIALLGLHTPIILGVLLCALVYFGILLIVREPLLIDILYLLTGASHKFSTQGAE